MIDVSKIRFNRTVVRWEHPNGFGATYTGTVVGTHDRFLLVKDSIGTEGILPEWVSHSYIPAHLA